MTTTEPQAAQVYQVLIKATPERVWEAITQPEFTRRYFYGSRVRTTAEVGGPLDGYDADGTLLVRGEVLESDPPHRLVHTWLAMYDDTFAAEGPSRVTWEIEGRDDGVTLLTVTHDRLEDAPGTAEHVSGLGWLTVLHGLKTLLETGEPLLDFP